MTHAKLLSLELLNSVVCIIHEQKRTTHMPGLFELIDVQTAGLVASQHVYKAAQNSSFGSRRLFAMCLLRFPKHSEENSVEEDQAYDNTSADRR